MAGTKVRYQPYFYAQIALINQRQNKGGVLIMYDPKEVLEVCKKAKPGPWDVSHGDWDCDWECGRKWNDPKCYNEIINCEHIKQRSAASLSNAFTVDCGDYMGLSDENADFISLARMALPEFAERIIKLEKEKEVLVTELLGSRSVSITPSALSESESVKQLESQVIYLHRELISSIQHTHRIRKAMRDLEDENVKLQTVAEATKYALALLTSGIARFDNGVEVYGVGNEGEYMAVQIIESLRKSLIDVGLIKESDTSE